MSLSPRQLAIFHFNDVYNIEPGTVEPTGGAARLVTAYKEIQHEHPMVLFSGDCLNPSMISSVQKGSQMLPVFESVNLTCAVLGNHEFDFGMEVLEKFMDKCSFPWLLSNVMDKCTGLPLAGAKRSYLLSWYGVKVGFVGLAEEEWLVTLPTLDLTDMIFTDFVQSGREVSRELRQKGADIVIALTHMTMRNDIKLLEECDGIDLVLGGHDHDYSIEEVDSKFVIKSGSDFQSASYITLTLTPDNNIHSVIIEKITLDSSVAEDHDMKEVVDGYLESFDRLALLHLGYSDADLDGTFSHVRTMETNLGNLVADVMADSTGADIALLNSGTLRSNLVHPQGPFTSKDLHRILPLFDQLCVLEVSGRQLHKALENGVSRYPSHNGRFPQVSGIRFSFNPDKTPGCRIRADKISVNGMPLDYNQIYTLCVKEYIARGRDDYAVLRDCPVIVSCQNGPVLATAVQNFFEGVVWPCRTRGCIHSHCNHEDSNYNIISHHQRRRKSPNRELKHIPSVEGRIKIELG